MDNKQAESTDTDQKWCRHCKCLRPITDFRFQNKVTGQRHPECRTCRRERERAHEDRNKQRTVRQDIHKLRRLESLEGIDRFLELLVFKVGGHERLAEIWAEMMSSKDLPISYRMTFLATMIHLGMVYEQTRHTSSIVKSAEHLKKLNKAQLVEWIRQLRFSGYLSIEDVDPPGDWHGFDPW